MDPRLSESATAGDIEALNKILKEDPLVLQRVSLSSSPENPLHISSLAGHLDFSKHIINLMPSFAFEVGKDGFTPLHMAAAAGHVEIVIELVSNFGSELCLLKDKLGRIPLHLAAIRGRFLVIEKLVSEFPDGIEQVTALGETAMLLAVKNWQFDAFRILFEASSKLENFEDLIAAKDDGGNTVLELAIATKQLQVIDFLKQQNQWTHQEITVLQDAPGDDTKPENQNSDKNSPESQKSDPFYLFKMTWGYLYGKDIIPVVASLIAGATYTAGLNPPPTIWKEGMNLDTKCIHSQNTNNNDPFQFQSCVALRFYVFMVCNTVAFAASILLLPFHRYQAVAPLLIITSLSCMLWTYLTSAAILSPNPAFIYFVYVVMCVGFLVLLGLPAFTVVLQIRPVFGKMKTKLLPASSSSLAIKS